MKSKSIFLFICVLILCFVLGSSVVLGKTKISLWSVGNENAPFYEKVVGDYEESHPNVEVDFMCYNLSDFEQKLAVTIPTNTTADILASEVYTMDKFVQAGFIPPNPPDIDAMLKKEGIFPQFLVDIATYKNNTFGLPWFRSIPALFWNKKMFAEAGLPGAPTNWDEIISYAQKLARYDKNNKLTRSGISLRLSGAGSGVAEKWWMFLYMAGGTILEKYPDGKHRAGYDNEAGRKTLKLYIDLLYKYHVDDPNIKHDADAFSLGATAMFIRESWVVGYLKEYAPQLEYDTAPLPSDKRAGILQGSDSFYVTKSCKDPEIAWDFIKFSLQPKYQKYLFEKVGWAPARIDVDYSNIYEKVPQYRNFANMPNYDSFGPTPITCFDEIVNRLAQRLIAAFSDQTLLDNPDGIARVIHEAAEETNNILKENKFYHED